MIIIIIIIIIIIFTLPAQAGLWAASVYFSSSSRTHATRLGLHLSAKRACTQATAKCVARPCCALSGPAFNAQVLCNHSASKRHVVHPPGCVVPLGVNAGSLCTRAWGLTTAWCA